MTLLVQGLILGVIAGVVGGGLPRGDSGPAPATGGEVSPTAGGAASPVQPPAAPSSEVAVRFDAMGLKLSCPGRGSQHSAQPWSFGLSLESLRRGTRSVSAGLATIERGDQFLLYDHGVAMQWFFGQGHGIEQLFAIQQDPLGGEQPRERLELEIQLRMEGDVCVVIGPTGNDATLYDRDGHPVASYTGLAAWDSLGFPLGAKLRSEGELLTIVVDDTLATYPIVVDPLIGCLRARLLPADISADCNLGESIGIDGDRLVIGAVDHGPGPPGAVYVYQQVSGEWIREAKLVSTSLVDDGFGASVALSGDTLAIGAVGASDFGPGSGAVFVYVRAGNLWTLQARLLALDGGAWNLFGGSVAVHADRLVISANNDDDQGPGSGSIYVFDRVGSTWTQSAKLLPNNGAPWDLFGFAVDVRGPIIVGTSIYHGGGGAAYVWEAVGNGWSQIAYLTAYPSGQFGWSASIGATRLVIGEPRSPGGPLPGRVHTYGRAGNSWLPETILTPADSVAGDFFGASASLSNDTLIVGAPYAPWQGAAYVFSRATGSWQEESKLVPPTTAWNPEFGYSVDTNGQSFCVGSPRDSQVASSAGVGYVYELVASAVSYCTGKTNSLGCAPGIAAQGAGSASASQGMLLTCSQVRNNTPGLLLYSTAGRASLPFQGGLLCLNAPLRRTPGLGSGGTPSPAQDCSGAFSIDMNTFARGLLGGQPIPELSVIGTVVQCQWWGRDQGFPPPFNSMLSDAIEYTIVQ